MDFGSTLNMVLIPVVAIVCGLGLPALIVYLVLRAQKHRLTLLHETVQKLADRGLPVPQELLDPPRRAMQGSPQFRAITLLGVAAGLAVMFYLLDLVPLMGIGALLACIGIAQLIALRLEPQRPADPYPPARP